MNLKTILILYLSRRDHGVFFFNFVSNLLILYWTDNFPRLLYAILYSSIDRYIYMAFLYDLQYIYLELRHRSVFRWIGIFMWIMLNFSMVVFLSSPHFYSVQFSSSFFRYFVFSHRSICCFLRVAILNLTRQWVITTRQPWHVPNFISWRYFIIIIRSV